MPCVGPFALRDAPGGSLQQVMLCNKVGGRADDLNRVAFGQQHREEQNLSRVSAGGKGKKAVRLTDSENLAERRMQQQAAQICQGEEASVVCKGHT